MPLRILFVMRHAGYTRNFESVLRLLAERGHRVHIVLERERSENPQSPSQVPLIARLCDECPNLTYGLGPVLADDGWSATARAARQARDYLRYLHPRYRQAVKLRQRAEGWAPRPVRRLVHWRLVRTRLCLAALGRLLRWVDQAIPHSPMLEVFLQEQHPDVLLVTPLVEPGSRQAEYLRAARALGIGTVLCVHSWDNLTNKGLIHECPDLVTVWNAAQRREAIELHGMPASKINVTGASAYDHWFTWSLRTARQEFCQRVGLAADRPFLLYVCSSPFVAPAEARFVRRWIRQLRQCGESRLPEVGVLVRPHPQHAAQWQTSALSGLDNAVLWPPAGADPVTPAAKADYYDSIYHSSAVVGVNTSALVESAIVGRSSYTLVGPEFRDTQVGTLHFHYLLRENGGPLQVAGSLEEQMAQLSEALASDMPGDDHRMFVETFIRPGGLDVPATPKLVSAIEQLCFGHASGPHPRGRWATVEKALLTPLVCAVDRARQRPPRRPACPERAFSAASERTSSADRDAVV
jgi:hypothetical protein